jgi:hypothetical protein
VVAGVPHDAWCIQTKMNVANPAVESDSYAVMDALLAPGPSQKALSGNHNRSYRFSHSNLLLLCRVVEQSACPFMPFHFVVWAEYSLRMHRDLAQSLRDIAQRSDSTGHFVPGSDSRFKI